MLELPRYPSPNFVDNYELPKSNINKFESDSGLQTRVQNTCQCFGFTFSLKYDGHKPDELGQLLRFSKQIGYDGATNISLRSFRIPKSHPLWEKVAVWAYIEDMLIADTLDDALWVMIDAGDISVQFVNFHKFDFKVQEVYE